MNKWISDWRRRKKVRKIESLHFDSGCIYINKYKLSSVHVIPEKIRENQELDFYLDTKFDIYLLRLINNTNQKITIFPVTKPCNMVYIVAETLFNTENFDYTLKNIIDNLKKAGIPRIVNPKEKTTIKL